MEIETIKERIREIHKEIQVMKWDKLHNQLNPNKEGYLKKLQLEKENLEQSSMSSISPEN